MTAKVSLSSNNLSKADWRKPGQGEQPVFSVAQIRALEQQAFEQCNSWTLMLAAGTRAASRLADRIQHLPAAKTKAVLVLAGPGNNGGDALVVAYELLKKGFKITLRDFGTDLSAQSTDRRRASELIGELTQPQPQPQTQPLLTLANSNPNDWDEYFAVVDGLLGIGCSRPPEGEMLALIKTLRAHQAKQTQLENPSPIDVIALDCPSGLDCDTGHALGIAIQADLTLTFIGLKQGLFSNDGRDLCGEIWVDPLGCEALLSTHTTAPFVVIRDERALSHALPNRLHSQHKGSHGSVVVYGGETGMIGASVLAARTSLMLGAGRVAQTLLCEWQANSDVCLPLPARWLDPIYPELMNKTLEQSLDFCETGILGPGLGQTPEALDFALQALANPKAKRWVIDADGLNLLAKHAEILQTIQNCHGQNFTWVLTPHPLEAARLLNCSVSQILDNRIQSAVQLARQYGATVVLKGSGTVIASPEGGCSINITGGPALSTGGSGDVLAGAIGALLSQNMEAMQAAELGVWLHGASINHSLNHPGQVHLSHASEIALRMKELANGLLQQRDCRGV